MNFLFIGDPIRNLKAKTDSSLALVREYLYREHEVHWTTAEDLYLWEGRVYARVDNITACVDQSLPATENIKDPQPINSYDGVWIRKDPPFDQSYFSLCWLLALEEKNVPIFNKPSLLLRYHEKLLPLEAVEQGFLQTEEVIPTFMPTGKRLPIPTNFPRGESVSKPWLGFAGKDVTLLPSPQTPEPYFLLQPLQKEIHRSGDRRVFFLDGDVIGSFVRMPPEGDIRSNIASGGKGVLKDMSKKEIALTDRVGAFLKEVGIVFAGADMIHEKISEINITSPTGLLTYHSIGGPKLAPNIVNFTEEQT